MKILIGISSITILGIIYAFIKNMFKPKNKMIEGQISTAYRTNPNININEVVVTITPTYSGCPAMDVIESDIMAKLKEKNITHVTINTVLSPAWTTDWMKQDAKDKLREYGIAPPNKDHSCTDQLMGQPKDCPLCGSKNVELKSRFGSTACKSLYVCRDCLEPFDYFKCH